MRDISSGLIPEVVANTYDVYNWRNAVQVASATYPDEWSDLLHILGDLTSQKRDLDRSFGERGWVKRTITQEFVFDGRIRETRTHTIDHFRNCTGLTIAGGTCDESFAGALEAFRMLFDLQTLDVGILVLPATRASARRAQLIDVVSRLRAGESGGCPCVIFSTGEHG